MYRAITDRSGGRRRRAFARRLARRRAESGTRLWLAVKACVADHKLTGRPFPVSRSI